MRIQHNIAALNAYRNLTNNNSAVAKNLEKLSSGYKINRAGDDAAGLAISEKMRAQITGLQTAQKNANDGISLVQTAEGALTEVHSMLNRMVELATQSANGTYADEVDRENLQAEVDSLLDEINRISESTNFNGINLLDGSMNGGGTVTKGGEKSDVPILQDVATDPTTEVGTKTVLHGADIPEGKTEINVELHNLTVTGKEGDKFTLTVGETAIELTFGNGGDLDADTAYSGQELAEALADKFAADGGTINGQAFTATAGKGTLEFKQVNMPTKQDEVVPANVAVKAEHTPAGGAGSKVLSVDIAADALAAGDIIKIGDTEITLGVGETIATKFANDTTVGNYTVKYEDGKLNITDPAGGSEVKISTTKYQTTATTVTGTFTEGKVAVAATGVLAAQTPNGGSAAIDGYKWNAAGNALEEDTPGPNGYTASATQNADDNTKYDITVTAATAGAAANGTTLGGVTVNGGSDAVKAKVEFDLSNLKAGDKVTIDSAATPIVVAVDKDGNVDAATKNALEAALTETGYTTTFANGKLSIEQDTASNVTTAPSHTVAVTSYDTTELTAKPPVENPAMTGTYNVQSTVNEQGAQKGATQLASTAFDLTTDIVKDGQSLTIGDKTYIFKVGADSTTTAGKTPDGEDQILIDLSNVDEAGLLDAAGAALANQSDGNTAFTIGYAKADGKITIHEKADQTKYTKELQSVEEFDKLVYVNKAIESKQGKALSLQIGDTSDDFNKLTLSIESTSAEALGIGGLSIATQTDAADAVDKIKAAINKVSSTRGDLGAVQNRLEHTINNLSVQTENITAAESRIRDVDMAEEMMAYTKNNILVQAAQAMLAQANQVPQGVLQLLQ